MQEIKRLLKEAKDKMLQADHLAFSTYPQVQEPKMLALIVDNVNMVFLNCMESLLMYERMYKRIEPVKGDFNSELMLLRDHCFRRYGYPGQVGNVIAEVKMLADKKRTCPQEFRRKDNYILCSEDYKLDAINFKTVKNYVHEAKRFLDKTLEVIR